MKVCGSMANCCKICHIPIEDENNVIKCSNNVYHRHCYNFTIDNYCDVDRICKFKNIKSLFTSSKGKAAEVKQS